MVNVRKLTINQLAAYQKLLNPQRAKRNKQL